MPAYAGIYWSDVVSQVRVLLAWDSTTSPRTGFAQKLKIESKIDMIR